MLAKIFVCAFLLQVVFSRPEEAERRIAGGAYTAIDSYPYQVAVTFPGDITNTIRRCGGSLIYSNIAITAAHCTKFPPHIRAQGKVRVGSTNFDYGGQELRIIEIRDYPNYVSHTQDGDLSLLKLEYYLQMTNLVQTISLASKPIRTDRLAVVTGWGQTRSGDPKSLSNELKAVEIPLISAYDCRFHSNHRYSITDNMICAGYVNYDSQNTCQGDSGGPLVSDGELVGIVSWGNKFCARRGYPGVFVNVYNFVLWIVKTAAELQLY